MDSVLIIGCGAAGSVVVKKCIRLKSVFKSVHVASRRLEPLEALSRELPEIDSVSQVDAASASDVAALLKRIQPDLVINMALPYHDLPIMDACLEVGVHYMDTANYEPPDEAKFCYGWQWAYQDRFKDAGLMALLGSGFDPGVTNVFTAYLAKHYFDEIHQLDIVDCNAGDHGHPFATNFNPEINIREITQRGKYFQNGEWIETDPLSESKEIEFPEVGPRKGYLMYHEELESLVKHFPTLTKARFWMTFSESYLTYLDVLQHVGMTSIEPIEYDGQSIVPLQFLKSVLPNPSSLAENYQGKTCIGCIVSGLKDGEQKRYFIYNVCHHQDAFKDVGSQAVSYTTGVPAMIGALMMAQGHWSGAGVFNMEEFDPDPFMEALNTYGLPWSVIEC